MKTIAHKYEMFGETSKAVHELTKFANNYFVLQSLLIKIQKKVENTQISQLGAIEQELAFINHKFDQLFSQHLFFPKNLLPRQKMEALFRQMTKDKKIGNILFDSSHFEPTAQMFHKSCDKKGPTLNIIHLKSDNITLACMENLNNLSLIQTFS